MPWREFAGIEYTLFGTSRETRGVCSLELQRHWSELLAREELLARRAIDGAGAYSERTAFRASVSVNVPS